MKQRLAGLLVFAAAINFLTGCSTWQWSRAQLFPFRAPGERFHHTEQIDLTHYAKPFGHAPVESDLKAVFLALPAPLVGDMTVRGRKLFHDDRLLDLPHKFFCYYNDNAYTASPSSCIFYLKILPSTRYRYVVFIHMWKPDEKRSPNAANTFVLAPSGSQWIDVTSSALPAKTPRDWFFLPQRLSDVVQAGPYQPLFPKYRRLDGALSEGGWRVGPKKYDLLWQDDHFEARPPKSNGFDDGWSSVK